MAEAPNPNAARAPDWRNRPERSNLIALRMMTWVSLRLGRRASRVILRAIAAYFVVGAPAARRASADYLRRVLQLPADAPVGWRRLYAHFMHFASVVHDRIYIINDQFDAFDIALHRHPIVLDALDRSEGVLLISAHVGSFEVLRSLGAKRPGTRVAMVMYEENARKINTVLRAINPRAQQDVVALGKVDSMLNVHALFDANTVVGMMGDRLLGPDATRTIDFLGAPVEMPLGPFRIAAILRKPVVFMVGLYGGGNRYDIHFESLADFSSVPARGRGAAVDAALQRYVELLEHYCRLSPYNWFNFYDYWQPPIAAPAAPADPSRPG